MFSTGRAQINVTDPVGLAIVAAILIAVAALATLYPYNARRVWIR